MSKPALRVKQLEGLLLQKETEVNDLRINVERLETQNEKLRTFLEAFKAKVLDAASVYQKYKVLELDHFSLQRKFQELNEASYWSKEKNSLIEKHSNTVSKLKSDNERLVSHCKTQLELFEAAKRDQDLRYVRLSQELDKLKKVKDAEQCSHTDSIERLKDDLRSASDALKVTQLELSREALVRSDLESKLLIKQKEVNDFKRRLNASPESCNNSGIASLSYGNTFNVQHSGATLKPSFCLTDSSTQTDPDSFGPSYSSGLSKRHWSFTWVAGGEADECREKEGGGEGDSDSSWGDLDNVDLPGVVDAYEWEEERERGEEGEGKEQVISEAKGQEGESHSLVSLYPSFNPSEQRESEGEEEKDKWDIEDLRRERPNAELQGANNLKEGEKQAEENVVQHHHLLQEALAREEALRGKVKEYEESEKTLRSRCEALEEEVAKLRSQNSLSVKDVQSTAVEGLMLVQVDLDEDEYQEDDGKAEEEEEEKGQLQPQQETTAVSNAIGKGRWDARTSSSKDLEALVDLAARTAAYVDSASQHVRDLHLKIAAISETRETEGAGEEKLGGAKLSGGNPPKVRENSMNSSCSQSINHDGSKRMRSVDGNIGSSMHASCEPPTSYPLCGRPYHHLCHSLENINNDSSRGEGHDARIRNDSSNKRAILRNKPNEPLSNSFSSRKRSLASSAASTKTAGLCGACPSESVSSRKSPHKKARVVETASDDVGSYVQAHHHQTYSSPETESTEDSRLSDVGMLLDPGQDPRLGLYGARLTVLPRGQSRREVTRDPAKAQVRSMTSAMTNLHSSSNRSIDSPVCHSEEKKRKACPPNVDPAASLAPSPLHPFSSISSPSNPSPSASCCLSSPCPSPAPFGSRNLSSSRVSSNHRPSTASSSSSHSSSMFFTGEDENALLILEKDEEEEEEWGEEVEGNDEGEREGEKREGEKREGEKREGEKREGKGEEEEEDKIREEKQKGAKKRKEIEQRGGGGRENKAREHNIDGNDDDDDDDDNKDDDGNDRIREEGKEETSCEFRSCTDASGSGRTLDLHNLPYNDRLGFIQCRTTLTISSVCHEESRHPKDKCTNRKGASDGAAVQGRRDVQHLGKAKDVLRKKPGDDVHVARPSYQGFMDLYGDSIVRCLVQEIEMCMIRAIESLPGTPMKERGKKTDLSSSFCNTSPSLSPASSSSIPSFLSIQQLYDSCAALVILVPQEVSYDRIIRPVLAALRTQGVNFEARKDMDIEEKRKIGYDQVPRRNLQSAWSSLLNGFLAVLQVWLTSCCDGVPFYASPAPLVASVGERHGGGDNMEERVEDRGGEEAGGRVTFKPVPLVDSFSESVIQKFLDLYPIPALPASTEAVALGKGAKGGTRSEKIDAENGSSIAMVHALGRIVEEKLLLHAAVHRKRREIYGETREEIFLNKEPPPNIFINSSKSIRSSKSPSHPPVTTSTPTKSLTALRPPYSFTNHDQHSLANPSPTYRHLISFLQINRRSPIHALDPRPLLPHARTKAEVESTLPLAVVLTLRMTSHLFALTCSHFLGSLPTFTASYPTTTDAKCSSGRVPSMMSASSKTGGGGNGDKDFVGVVSRTLRTIMLLQQKLTRLCLQETIGGMKEREGRRRGDEDIISKQEEGDERIHSYK